MEDDSNKTETSEGADPVEEQNQPVPDATPTDNNMATEQATPAPQTAKTSKLKQLMHNNIFLAAVGILLLGGMFGLGLMVSGGDEASNGNVATETPEEVELPNDVEEDFEASEEDLKHLDVPDEEAQVSSGSGFEELAYIEAFTEAGVEEFYKTNYALDQDNLKNNISWWKIGVVNGDDVLIGAASSEGLFTFYTRHVFLRDSTGNLTLLSQHTDEGAIATVAGVEVDDTMTLEALSPPGEINVDGAKLKSVTGWLIPGIEFGLGFDNALDGYDELEDTDHGMLYEKIEDNEDTEDNGVKSYKLMLEGPFGTITQYRFTINQLLDDNSMLVNFANGDSTNLTYRWDTVERGCGSSHQVNVLAKEFHKDLVETGSTSDGTKVYGFPSSDHTVIGTFYDNYAGYRDESTVISQQEYFDGHNLVVVRNELSYYVLLSSAEYQANVECAKPVIYLYPEVPTYVSVEVGANVTLSDPVYDDGWSAIALPGGKLITGTGVYDSLFWDGTGHGQYPAIEKGNFVTRAGVEAELVANMTRMGLNENEISDFLEYWMPLMPDSNYVRLTWLTTAEMNDLAPLSLSFTPDSMIRIFLDFEGVDAPHNLPPQEIPVYERHGFSLIEWGGLRVGN